LGDIRGAIRSMREKNILAATCAQVCPTCRLCVEACSRTEIDEPIRVAEIQAFLAEYERDHNMEVLIAPEPGDRRICVIGSGPTGLSAAANLALKGYQVTVFEKMPEPGGLLRYGIPDFRLSQDLVTHEISLIKKLGVEFKVNHPVCKHLGVEELLKDGYDALLVATGCDQMYKLGLKGENLKCVYPWDEFLSAWKDRDEQAELGRVVGGKRVVVVGGGSVAMDCAISAKRFGADRVYAISLESMEELPADIEEKEMAFEEGVRFRSNCRVTEILGSDGAVSGIKGIEIQWKKAGWFVPENAVDVPGTEFSLPADVVVTAIGAGVSEETRDILSDLDLAEDGRPKIDEETMRTSDPRVFAGGDLGGARKTVASSVLDGKKAADAIAEAYPLSKPVNVIVRHRPSLEIDFCGLHFQNPFCLSSSPVSNTAEMISRAFDCGWGGVVFKTLGLEEDYEIIDPTPRLNALHHGDQRFIGLQNIEMITERPFEQNLKDIAWLKKHYPDRPMIVSIMGYSNEGWVELAEKTADAGADMLELNFSCPQMAIEGAGHKIGQAYDMLTQYTRVVKDAVSIPVMAKMTPNITDMIPVAVAAKRGGADAISAINTVLGITDVDLETFSPKPSIEGRGSPSGYSGPGVKPIALRFVSDLARSEELNLPISGLGGLETWQDAAMFLLMGASNLQCTTGVMRYGYRIIDSLCGGLQDYLEDMGMKSVGELVGRGLELTVDPSEHHQKMHVISKVDPDKCIGCGLCYVVCHDAANQAMTFDNEKRKAETDKERCVGCLLCQHVCPVWDCIGTEEIDHVIHGGMHEDALEFVKGD
jgi:dihydropyrimidine dehydrogenase (NAD+) subunit PreA